MPVSSQGVAAKAYTDADKGEPKHLDEFATRIEKDWIFSLAVRIIRCVIGAAQVSVSNPTDDPRAEACAANLTERWKDSVPFALKAWGRGRAAFELVWCYQQATGLHELCCIDYLEFKDTELDCDQETGAKNVCLKVNKETYTLGPGKSWWFAFNERPSKPHGESAYVGAPHEIWQERNSLRKDFKVWLNKFALGHGIGRAPSQYPPQGNRRQTPQADINLDSTPADPLQDLHRGINQTRSGGVLILPSEVDDKGNKLWDYEPPITKQDAAPLENREKSLNDSALLSVGIPPLSVMQQGTTGSYSLGQVHERLLLNTCEEVLSQMARSFQENVVDVAERINCQPGRCWKLKVIWQKLDPALAQLAVDLVKAIVGGPQLSPLIEDGLIDFPKLAEIVRLPIGDNPDQRMQQVKADSVAAKQNQGPPGGGGANPFMSRVNLDGGPPAGDAKNWQEYAAAASVEAAAIWKRLQASLQNRSAAGRGSLRPGSGGVPPPT
jgi:hypothetical protein